MGCKAQTTAIAQLWRGFATPQTAQSEDAPHARNLFSVALSLVSAARASSLLVTACHTGEPSGVAIDAAGDVFVSDANSAPVR